MQVNKLMLIWLLFMWAFSVKAAEADVKLIYKTKYSALVKPLLANNLTEQLKTFGKTSDEIDAFLNNYADQMAECQIHVISSYDQKYQNAIYDVVASGGNVADSNAKLDSLIQHDLSIGELSNDHLTQLVQNAKSYMTQCSNNFIDTLNQ